MPSRRRLAALLLVAACGSQAGPVGTREGSTPPGPDLGPGVTRVAPAAGAPHAVEIDRIVPSPDGTAALTRDVGSRVRLWPALDGTAEPRSVPLSGVERLSLARRGDAFLAAAVDSAGGGRLVRIAADGRSRALADLPPEPPLRALVVLPGEGVLALGQDHRLRLLGDDGRPLASLETKGFRGRDLALAEDGRAAVVWELEAEVVPTPTPGSTGPAPRVVPAARFRAGGTARRLAITVAPAPRLAFVGEPVPFTQVTPADSSIAPAVSPDGRHLAVLVSDDDLKFWTLAVHDLVRGETREVNLPANATRRPRLSFVTPSRLYFSSEAGFAFLFELAAAGPLRRSPALLAGVASQPHAAAGGRLIAAHGTWLFVGDPGRAEGRRYLGFADAGVLSAALSPAGRRVAWILGGSHVRVDSLAGGEALAALEMEEDAVVVDAAFLDEDRLITMGPAYGVRLHDVTTGKLLHRAETGGGGANLDLDPERRLLRLVIGPSDPWVWLYEVDARAGFGAARMIPGGGRLSGFLRGERGSRVWTLAGDGAFRSFAPGELAALENVPVSAWPPGETLPGVDQRPLAVDPAGRRWYTKGVLLEVVRGAERRSVRGGEFDVRHLVPTGDAARVAIAYGSGLVLVLDAATLEPRLSLKPGGAVSRMSWSADGRWLAIAAESGGLVVAVDSGEVLARRCAGDFESRPLPPPRSTLSQAGVCE